MNTFAENYMYMNRSPSGSRIIGGSSAFLSKKSTHVVFTSLFPKIGVIFGNEPQGIAWSWIRRRGSTWQASLPVGRLGIPRNLYLSEENTRTIVVPGSDRVVFDLSWLADQRGSTLAHDAVLAEASELIFRLGGLYERFPWLQDELGITLVAQKNTIDS